MKHFLRFLRVLSSPNWVLIRDLENWYNQKQENKPEEQPESELEDFSPQKKRIYKKVDSSDMVACVAVFIVAFLLIIWMCM